MPSCIIIDDENLARVNLKESLRAYTAWVVLCELDDGVHAEAIIASIKPDVIFLDIQMPQLDGMTLIKKLANSDYKPIVVIVSAFDDYAIQAFEFHATDYLLKPFDQERFKVTLERLERKLSHRLQEGSGYNNRRWLKKLIVKSIGSIRIIDIFSVYHFKANGNYVEVHHDDGCHLYRSSLGLLLEQLDPKMFVRVHRKAIVRIDAIKEIKHVDEKKSLLLLKNGDSVAMSKTYREVLMQRVENH